LFEGTKSFDLEHKINLNNGERKKHMYCNLKRKIVRLITVIVELEMDKKNRLYLPRYRLVIKMYSEYYMTRVYIMWRCGPISTKVPEKFNTNGLTLSAAVTVVVLAFYNVRELLDTRRTVYLFSVKYLLYSFRKNNNKISTEYTIILITYL